MKTKIKMLRVRITENDNREGVVEGIDQIWEHQELVTYEGLQILIFKLNIEQILKLEILGQEEKELITEDDFKDLEIENAELKGKLGSCYNMFDSIYHSTDNIRDSLSDIEVYLEEIEESTCDGENFADYDE